jgi:hypothetical protein
MIRAALAAQIILHLGHGEYADAYKTAATMRRDDTINMSAEALPAIVEAGLRSGRTTEAAAALGIRTRVSPPVRPSNASVPGTIMPSFRRLGTPTVRRVRNLRHQIKDR